MLIAMEDYQINEDIHESESLYDIFKSDIDELGERSSDWWCEESEARESPLTAVNNETVDSTENADECGSPVFKTPYLDLKTKRRKRSCNSLLSVSSLQKRRRAVTSPSCDGSSELDWCSPFKSAKLSPIVSRQIESGTVPESLEALLEDGSDVSWSSAFATPLISNATWSNLNSNEKKVLMPSDIVKNPRVLFSHDKSLEDADCSKSTCVSEDTLHLGVLDTTFVFENSSTNTNILDISHFPFSSNENILCHSVSSNETISKGSAIDSSVTSYVDAYIMEGAVPVANISPGNDVLEKFEKYWKEEKSKLIEQTCQKMTPSVSRKKERPQHSKIRRCSLVKSPDSDMNDNTENSVNVYCGNSSPLARNSTTGLTVSRKLFRGGEQTNVFKKREDSSCRAETVSAVLEEDSGAVACSEISNGLLSTSLKLKCSQSTINGSVETLSSVAASNIQTTQDFPHDISYNTLEEICQVTELLMENCDSPIEQPHHSKDINLNKITPQSIRLSAPEKSCLSRTSTPITRTEKLGKADRGTAKKKIKFVHVCKNDKSHSLPSKHHDIVSNENKQEEEDHAFGEWSSEGDSVLEKAASEFDVKDVASRVHSLKMVANQMKKFTYSTSADMKLKAVFTQNKDVNVSVADVVKSVQLLEQVVDTKSKSSRKRLDETSSDNQGFTQFCKLQTHLISASKNNSVEDLKRINKTVVKPSTVDNFSHDPSSCNTISIEGKDMTNNETENACEFDHVSRNSLPQDCIHPTLHTETCRSQESKSSMTKLSDTITLKQSSETKGSFSVAENLSSSSTNDVPENSYVYLNNDPSVRDMKSKDNKFESVGKLLDQNPICDSKTAAREQIKASADALCLTMKLVDDISEDENRLRNQIVTSRDTGRNSVCDESKNIIPNITLGKSNKTSDKQSVTSDDSKKRFVSIEKFNVPNSHRSCSSSITQRKETVNKNCHNDGCNEIKSENCQVFFENKREQENLMSDSQMILAAEHAELLQQFAEEENIFTEWPYVVNQEMEKNGECHKSPHDTTSHENLQRLENFVPVEQKKFGAVGYVDRDLPESVELTLDGRNKSSSDKSLICTGLETEITGHILEQVKQLNEKNTLSDGIIRTEEESGIRNKIVHNVKLGEEEALERRIEFHSGDDDMEAILNNTVIRQLFTDNSESFKSESEIQISTTKSQNDILNADHNVLITTDCGLRSEQSDLSEVCMTNATVEAAAVNRVRDLGVAQDTLIVNKYDSLVRSTEVTELATDNESSKKVIAINTILNKVGLLLESSENCMYEKTTDIIPDNNSEQEHVRNARLDYVIDSYQDDLCSNGSAILPVNEQEKKEVDITLLGQTSANYAITSCSLLQTENRLQKLGQHSFTTTENQPDFLCQEMDVSRHTCVSNAKVPVTKISEDLSQNASHTLNCGHIPDIRDFTAINSNGVLTGKSVRDANSMYTRSDANANTIVGISLIDGCVTDVEKQIVLPSKTVNNCSPLFLKENSLTEAGKHGTEYSESEKKIEGYPELKGFATASGKQISVSAKALNRAKNLLSDDSLTEKVEFEKDSFEIAQEEMASFLLQKTRNPQRAQISKICSTYNPVISETCTKIEQETKASSLKDSETQALPVQQGLLTASGKEVSVSEKSLNRAKLLISEEELCLKSFEDEIQVSSLRQVEESPIVQDFATTGGKGLSESGETLNRPKLLFSEEKSDSKSAQSEATTSKFKELRKHDSPVFQDSSVASKKTVSVSTKALHRAKLLFSEEQNDAKLSEDATLHSEFKKIKMRDFPGFSTASGKTVSVSAKALSRAKLLFSEEQSDSKSTEDVTTSEFKKIKKQDFPGFSTASGKTVSVSAKALSRAKLLFSEEQSDSKSTEDVTTSEFKKIKKQDFPGFSTASGKTVSVSAKALSRAKLLFSEEQSGSKSTEEVTTSEFKEIKMQDSTVFQGFSTASDKRVSVSTEALQRAKLLFSEENANSKPYNDETVSSKLEELGKQDSPPFQGFSTASGKKVSISARSMNRAELLFSETGTNYSKPSEDETLCSEFKEIKRPVLQGFSTANEKKVSLSRTKLLEEQTSTSTVKNAARVPDLLEFLTESGKIGFDHSKTKMKFSEGLHYANQANVEHKFPQFKETKIQCSPTLQTSLTAAKQTEDEAGVTELERKEYKSAIVQGFSTASGKKLSVSAEFLTRAKLLFLEEEIPVNFETGNLELNKVKNKDASLVQGFSTASGKEVSVSAEALNKARVLFSELEVDAKAVENEAEITKLKESPPVLKISFSSNRRQISMLGEEINRDRVSISEEGAACAGEGGQETFTSDLLETRNIVPVMLQEFSSVIQKNGSVLPRTSDIMTHFISVEEVIMNESCVLQPEKPILLDTSRSLKKGRVPLTEVRGRKPHLSKKLLVSNKSTSSIAVQQPDATNLPRPLFLKENSNSVQENERFDGSRKSTMGEPCAQIKNLTTLVPTSDIQTNLYDGSVVQVQNYSTDILGNERKDCKVVPKKCGETDKVQMSVTQEVKESAAALLADEAIFDSPSWVVNYVTSPDMLYDREVAPTALLSSEGEHSTSVTVAKPGSPVLGSSDRFRKKRKIRTSQCSSVCGSSHNSQTPVASSFKVPYKNSDSLTGNNGTPKQTLQSKRMARHLEFGTPFAKRLRIPDLGNELHRNGHVSEDGKTRSEVIAGRQSAVEEQENLVRNGKSSGSSGSRPCKGSYYLRKQERQFQMKWREAVKGARPHQYSRSQLLKFGVKKNVIDVTAENAVEFRFSAWDYYSNSVCLENVTGLLVGDGAQLVLDAEGTAGLEEVARAFLISPGIDPILVPSGWVHNHYRWLVWKLAAVEHSFPQQFAARCLTPNMLLLQLKYRYDREIDCCQRPALRKILERDDSAAKRLVLCVARIIKMNDVEGDLCYELELTDGWYGLTASVDRELCRHIHRGTVAVGTKLISHGAELLNCEQGCPPLEVGSDVKLKLCSNSTRRARWDTKLGFHTRPGPLSISLTSVLPAGGLISCVSVTVVRVYPVIYVEKLGEGKSVIRSARAEERAATQWERSHQECVELLYSQMKAELHQESNNRGHSKLRYRAPSALELELICSGDRLCDILESVPDPTSVEELLNEEQKNAVSDYQRFKQEKMQQEFEIRVRERLKDTTAASRNVTPLLKVRCVDPRISMSTRSAMLSVWHPLEDVTQLLKEGMAVSLFNVSAAGIRSGDLQLSAGRQTVYHPSSCQNLDFCERRVSSLNEITSSDFRPAFGELDVVGMVAYISSSPQGNPGFQTVYLADAMFNILGMAFWGGIKQFCWEEIFKPRTLIAASNLQWRHGAAVRWIPCAYASELSNFSVNPRQPHLSQALASLRQEINQQELDTFFSACEDKVSAMLRGSTSSVPGLVSGRNPMPGFGDSPQIDGYRSPVSAMVIRGSINSPNVISRQVDCENRRMPSSSAPSGDTQELSVLNLTLDSSSVEQRLRKLLQYGEPPPLSSLVMIPIQPALRKEFNVPLRKESPVGSIDSPPLSLDSDPG